MGTPAEWLFRSISSAMPSSTEVELRAAPFALPSPVQVTVPNQGQVPDWNAELAVNSAYHGNLYVARCIEATANALSGLPFRAGADPEKPKVYSSAQYSRLALLLSPPPGSPNPRWTPRMLWKYAIIQYIITGKWVWLKEFSPGGQVIGLWPLPSQFITPVPVDPGSRGDRYFKGFNYRVQGKVKYFTADQVFYAYNPSQADHLQPESILRAASYRIGLAQMLDRYDHALMKNNAVPSTLVTTEPFATKEERRAFRQQFANTFGGYDNAGKTLFAEAEYDINTDGTTSNNVGSKVNVARLGMTSQELQQNEKYLQVVDDIHVALGTPKSVLGVATEATFANGAQELTNWWNERLLPLKAEIEDHVNIGLAPELGSHHIGWFDTSKVKALQPAQRFNAADISSLIKGDATPGGPLLSRDEGRAELGLEPWTNEQQKEYEKFRDEKIEQQQQQFEQQQKAVVPQQVPGDTRPPLALVKPNKPPVKALVTRQLSNLLIEQQRGLEQRATSRKGRKAENLAALLDVQWETLRAVEALAPTLSFLGLSEKRIVEYARKLVEDTRANLMTSSTVAEAFEDSYIATRVRSTAEHLLADAEPVPADHVEVLLRAVADDKLSSVDAYDKFREVC